jgi:anti-sigma B factor antagonist
MTEGANGTDQTPPTVVILPQEIDLVGGPAAAAELTGAIGGGLPVIVADLTRTTFVDSSGARLLYEAYREATATGTQLRLATSQPAVLRVLELMGFSQLLPIYPTTCEAMAAPPPAA